METKKQLLNKITLYKKIIGSQYRFGKTSDDGTIDYFVYKEATPADILSAARELVTVSDEDINALIWDILSWEGETDAREIQRYNVRSFINKILGDNQP